MGLPLWRIDDFCKDCLTIVVGISWSFCQMCNLILNVAWNDKCEIKYFDRCRAIDVWPYFHGNLDFSPRLISYLLRHALSINKIINLFGEEQVTQVLYAFVLADTKQKAANKLNIGFSFTWESGPGPFFLGRPEYTTKKQGLWLSF